MIEFWTESAKFNTSQRLSDQARMIFTKDWLKNLEILKIFGQVNSEEYEQDPLSKSKR